MTKLQCRYCGNSCERQSTVRITRGPGIISYTYRTYWIGMPPLRCPACKRNGLDVARGRKGAG